MPYFSFNNRKKRGIIFFSKYIIKKSDFFIFFYSKNINGYDKNILKYLFLNMKFTTTLIYILIMLF